MGQVVGARAPQGLERAVWAMFRELGVPEGEWSSLGLDIRNTPARVARMYRDELLEGYHPGAEQELERRFTTFASDGRDALVTAGPFDYSSLCAHHMLPFIGRAYVGYVPGACIIGASKIPRVLRHYSHMLQIQERLARQVAEFIYRQAQPQVVFVTLIGLHLCMKIRGVEQHSGRMVNTCIRPDAAVVDRGVIDEFYEHVRRLESFITI